MSKEKVRLSERGRDSSRFGTEIKDLNGDWEVDARWTEPTGQRRIKISRGEQTRDLPEEFVVPKK